MLWTKLQCPRIQRYTLQYGCCKMVLVIFILDFIVKRDKESRIEFMLISNTLIRVQQMFCKTLFKFGFCLFCPFWTFFYFLLFSWKIFLTLNNEFEMSIKFCVFWYKYLNWFFLPMSIILHLIPTEIWKKFKFEAPWYTYHSQKYMSHFYFATSLKIKLRIVL